MQTQARLSGAGLTRFVWQGQTIAWATSVRDTPPAPVASPGGVDIHPLDSPHPVEIALPMAVTSGTIVLRIQELWHQEAWETLGAAQTYGNGSTAALGPFGGARTLLEVFARQLKMGSILMQKIIETPGQPRVKNYHNCVITNVDESETIQIGSMDVARDITIKYTHNTWA